MSGCFGNSKEDRYFSNQLDQHLDSQDNGFTGSFTDYDITIELEDDKVLFVEISGRMENGEITSIEYTQGELQDGEDSKYVSKEEIDSSINMQEHADREVQSIIDWEVGA